MCKKCGGHGKFQRWNWNCFKARIFKIVKKITIEQIHGGSNLITMLFNNKVITMLFSSW